MRTALRATFSFGLLMVPQSAFAGREIYTLAVQPTAGQTSTYDHGIQSIDSRQTSSIVRVVNVPGNNQKDASFVVGVVNLASNSLNFGPENVVVRPIGMPPVALITYDAAMLAEQKKQSRQRFWNGVAAFGRNLSAADAGTSYTSGIYSGTASGYVGSDLVTAQSSGIYSSTRYNPAAARGAQRQAQEDNANDRTTLKSGWATRTAELDNLLRTTTVNRGMMYGGIARFSITSEIKRVKQPIQVLVEVTINGEKHLFSGQLTRSK